MMLTMGEWSLGKVYGLWSLHLLEHDKMTGACTMGEIAYGGIYG